MAIKKSSDAKFVEGAIRITAEVGIENLRTKQVADYAGFSEATLFRAFPSKENLLRHAFLHVDKEISDILISNSYLFNSEEMSFDQAVFTVWRKIYRRLIEEKEETLFLIRYRYSSLYNDDVRANRQAYNGSFEGAYDIIEQNMGSMTNSYRGFLLNYIFEMTLCFAEKIVTGRIQDAPDTERVIWAAISSAVREVTRGQKAIEN